MSIQKDLSELTKADIISQETADRINDYYKTKGSASTNRLFIVFGILGAILVGLGIILLLAHNWDDLSRGVKTFFAFLPLIIGQALCAFTLLKKSTAIAWRESSAAFLFFAVGASIALVAQIYNLPGNTAAFVLTWILLCLPLVYLMRSSVSSLLFIIGSTYYAAHVGYGNYSSKDSFVYYLLLLSIMPHYFYLYKNNAQSNFMSFHNWLVPLSLTISLGTAAKHTEELMLIAYMSLFGVFYTVGNSKFFVDQKSKNNGYKLFGLLGTLALLFYLSFDWFWLGLRRTALPFHKLSTAPEFYVSIITTAVATAVLYLQQKGKTLLLLKPVSVVFILFIITFIIGLSSSIAMVLINLFVFSVGVLTIRDGAKLDNLGTLNFGLIVIAILVACRFFDTNLSFIIRGLMFVSVGIGFFATNYWLLKKRKTNG